MSKIAITINIILSIFIIIALGQIISIGKSLIKTEPVNKTIEQSDAGRYFMEEMGLLKTDYRPVK